MSWFLKPEQLRLNTRVTDVEYGEDGVRVVLADGSALEADYAICTFRSVVLWALGDVC